MQLHLLSDDQLEQSFHHVVKTERKIMHIVILHVQEVAKRGLHLKRCKGDLKKYLITEMLYSSSAAQRRIEAANLLTAVPSVAAKLESGELNLSQIGEIHKAIQQAQKIHEERVTDSYKAKLVSSVLGQTKFETQKTCAEMLEIPVVESQSLRNQKDNSKRVEFTFTEKQFEKFELVKGILAHKNFQKKRTQMMNDILETAFDEIIEMQLVYEKKVRAKPKMGSEINDNLKMRNQPIDKFSENKSPFSESSASSFNNAEAQAEILKPEAHVNSESTNSPTQSRTAVVASSKLSAISFEEREPESLAKPNPKETWHSLTPRRKKIILQQDKCCQYKDYETGTKCGSTFNLEVDHIIPKYAGGTNDPGNLRALCRAHNQYRNRNQGCKFSSLFANLT
jgi:hypothetical protein